jgi:ATP-dependent DNA helicase Rep
LNKLNPRQREAVRHIDGPLLVLAGAGSGKTRVIAHKIEYLIKQKEVPPERISAITFTNKAAREMRERVSSLLPRKAKGPWISTFHTLGLRIMRAECALLGYRPGFSILDSGDCAGLLADLMRRDQPGSDIPVGEIQHQISSWKYALIAPDKVVATDFTPAQKLALRCYGPYCEALRAFNAVDFDDLIIAPVGLLQANEEVLERWRERIDYLLVDEYQDTNTCQYELVKQLVTGIGKKPMFTAVGDDDQAIYAWRGATIENLKQLQVDFPDLNVIKLEQNYRSSTRILQAANAVISNNPKLFEKQLWSEHGLGDPVKVLGMADDDQEAEQIAIILSAHRFERRAKFSDYAILYRGNHQARVIETALRKERIPYTISGGTSYFDRAEIKDVISYLRLIANQDDDPAFIRAVTTPKRGVGQSTLEVLGAFAGQWQCSLFEAVFKGGLEARLADRQLTPLREFCSFINEIEARATRIGKAASGDNAAAVLDDLMKGMNYEYYLYDNFDDRAAQNRWQNVTDFITWLKEKGSGGCDGNDPERSLLELTQMVALMTMLEGRDEEPDAVRMSTLHASKGLEFPHVFLVGVEEGILPHKGDPDAPIETLGARIEEERRLMYVGITRAQRSLHVSWCKKRKRARESVHCDISRFIKEMRLDEGTAVPTEAETITPQNRLANLKALLQKPKTEQ